MDEGFSHENGKLTELKLLAESVGFEPTDPLTGAQLSRLLV